MVWAGVELDRQNPAFPVKVRLPTVPVELRDGQRIVSGPCFSLTLMQAIRLSRELEDAVEALKRGGLAALRWPVDRN